MFQKKHPLKIAQSRLPNEIWLHIISLSQTMDEIRNISIIKSDLFTLFLHEFSPSATGVFDGLYFRDLAIHQFQKNPELTTRFQDVDSWCNRDTVFLHEICQRKPSDTYGRENHGVYRYAGDEVYTINNRDFQNYYHQDKLQLKKPLYYAFNIRGYLSVSNSVERRDNNGTYRFLWNVKFPELFIFPDLYNLIVYNETLNPSNIHDISKNLNQSVFPKLKSLQFNSVSRDSPITIEDVDLPSLESLSIRWGMLTKYTNVSVPNLKELEIAMISLPEDSLRLEETWSLYNIPFVEIDSSSSLISQLEQGSIRYKNPSFHDNSDFSQLRKFHLTIFDTFHNSLNPYFLYFLDNMTSFKDIENLRLDLLHLENKVTYSDQKKRSIDALIEILHWKILGKLKTVTKPVHNKIKNLHIHAPADSKFLDGRLIEKFTNFINIEVLSLLNISITKDISFDRLSQLKVAYFKLRALSSFIYLKSENLKSLLIELDITKPDKTCLPAAQTTLTQYLLSFNESLPNLKEISLSFQYTFPRSLVVDHLWDLPQYDIFSTGLTLNHISNLSLFFTFAQVLDFFEQSDLFHFPALKCLLMECELRTCYDLVNPKEQTKEALTKGIIPRIAVNAPELKKLVLNLTNQCDLHPEHIQMLCKIEVQLQSVKIDYYPLLFKICYKDDDPLFKTIYIDSRSREQNIVLRGSDYDDCDYHEGEELTIVDDGYDSDEDEPLVQLEYYDSK